MPNLERVTAYMQREHAMAQAEVKRQLGSACKEGYIYKYTAVSKKNGFEQDAYKVTSPEELDSYVSSPPPKPVSVFFKVLYFLSACSSFCCY